MEWSDVKIFLAIARSGTLGGAARTLHTSHPTVGRRLRALEEAIGHTLFQRTADGLVLTEEGHGIITLAEQMEEGALALERRLAGQEQNLKGNLRISSADWFGAYVLPPIVADFSKAYPNVDVEILTGTRLFNLAQRGGRRCLSHRSVRHCRCHPTAALQARIQRLHRRGVA